LQWNVFKGERPGWKQDFLELSAHHDLVLIQEAWLDQKANMATTWIESGLGWLMATSFLFNDGTPTGVANGSKFQALNYEFLRSPDSEPLSNTPKMTLLSEFAVAGKSTTLLVANIHAINFAPSDAFARQLAQVELKLEDHAGPIVFAGDFNTRNGERENLLLEMTKRLGMKKIVFDRKSESKILDHTFVRDLQVIAAHVNEDILTSDHKPMRYKLKFK